MLKLLVDGDMMAYISSAAVEQEVTFGDVCHLYSSSSDAKAVFTNKMNYLIETLLIKLKHKGKFEVLYTFSDDDHNFRKDVLPEYKANRNSKRKPVCYKELVEWVKETYKTLNVAHIEADDLMGILGTQCDNTVILSGDKDLKQIPTRIFNVLSGELTTTTKEESFRLFLYQTLIGDTTDNYKGCPKMGPVTATKLLDKDCSWKAVVEAYKKQGLTEEDALQQARVARILQDGEYDFKTGKVTLWNP